MTKVAILGAGQIGRAVYQIITSFRTAGYSTPYSDVDVIIIDGNTDNLALVDSDILHKNDLADLSVETIAHIFTSEGVTHVINALPFFLNEKVATAVAMAGCNYIDFTEDDVMADKVQAIFKDTNLTCAVKCGLAPGFINYIGYSLVSKVKSPDSLMISVGALPRTVSFQHPANSYNLSWSVDGLVNEYIRPCRVRKDGVEAEVAPLTNLETVILDGTTYEAAYTSGGVGSLVRDLTNVPNVHYMTLRYPGHYKYVQDVVKSTGGDFDKMRKQFLEVFPFTDDDVIVVYANATGKDTNGAFIRRSYYNKFYGVNGLTGIQSTTAGSGVAMLELMLTQQVSGIVNHPDVDFSAFTNTLAFKKYYRDSK